jgi:hypothetical protein
MQRSWALEWGLPAIAFTEHIDHTVWTGPWTPSALTNSHLASVGFFGRGVDSFDARHGGYLEA